MDIRVRVISFIKLLVEMRMDPYYLEDFKALEDEFALNFAGSYFSKDRIKLDIGNALQEFMRKLRFTDHKLWPVSITILG